jgi:hypothetical protein
VGEDWARVWGKLGFGITKCRRNRGTKHIVGKVRSGHPHPLHSVATRAPDAKHDSCSESPSNCCATKTPINAHPKDCPRGDGGIFRALEIQIMSASLRVAADLKEFAVWHGAEVYGCHQHETCATVPRCNPEPGESGM